MSYKINYQATCCGCGATKGGKAEAMVSAGWKMLHVWYRVGEVKSTVDVIDGWVNPVGNDCICKDCYDAYYALQEKADEAQQAAYDALGKFTPTPSPSGGSGTEDDPYTFQAGVVCVLNAFYTNDGVLYVYMPADAEAKSYASWDEAQADFVEWTE